MRIVSVLALAMALAACQTPCLAPISGAVATKFECEDGSDLDATFSRGPDLVRVMQEGYAPISLPARMTGSGYRYAERGAELQGRGAEVRWTRPGAAETLCRRSR